MRIFGRVLAIALLGLPTPAVAQSAAAWLDQAPPSSRVLQPLDAPPPDRFNDAPPAIGDRLAVPSMPIPTRRPEDPGVPSLQISNRAYDPTSGEPPPPPIATFPSGPRYRLLVRVQTPAEQRSLASLVPDAFPNSSDQMQAGVFSDRDRAAQLLQSLNSLGLQAVLETLP